MLKLHREHLNFQKEVKPDRIIDFSFRLYKIILFESQYITQKFEITFTKMNIQALFCNYFIEMSHLNKLIVVIFYIFFCKITSYIDVSPHLISSNLITLIYKIYYALNAFIITCLELLLIRVKFD